MLENNPSHTLKKIHSWVFVFLAILFWLPCLSQNPPNTSVVLDSTLLPIFIITTGTEPISSESKRAVHLKVIFDSTKNYQKPSDTVYDYDGMAGFKYRGNSSLSFPKKSYAFETWAADSTGMDTSLLGFPEEEDWILLANYIDPSHMKNKLMHWIWGNTGNYAVKTRSVEVIIDGTYHGLYLFAEKIKRDKNRVDINKLKPSEITGNDLTGGYIIKRDSRDPQDTYYWQSPYFNYYKPFIVVYPKVEDLQTEQLNYIKNYFNTFEHALHGNNFSDSLIGYRPYIDELSFVDYFLVQEFAMNVDGYDGSNYYSKDKNGELKVGPVWDFDESLANSNECMSTTNSRGWIFKSFECIRSSTIFWWERLTQDCYYANLALDRYSTLRSTVLDTTLIFNEIDVNKSLIKNAIARDKTAWNYSSPEHSNEITELKKWISDRITWMDANIHTAFQVIPTVSVYSSSPPGYQSVRTLQSNGCIGGGQPSWEWHSEHFSGESNGSTLTLKVQSDTDFYNICTYSDGCKSTSIPLKLKLRQADIGCLESQNITNSIDMNPNYLFRKYQSEDVVIMSNKLEQSGKLLLQSNKNITLEPGFETENNTVFKAQIKECDTN